MAAVLENIQLACAVCRIGVYSVFRRLCCKSPPPPRPEFSPVCIGLGNAGKTTLLCILAGESLDDIEPTTGFIIKATQFKTAILNVKEIGGGEKVRAFWKHYYKGAEAVIYVVDSACNDDELSTSKDALHDALCAPELRDLPLLVLANCQDKKGARTAKQIETEFELAGMCVGRKWHSEACTMNNKAELREIFERFNVLLVDPEAAEEEEAPQDQDVNRI